MTNSYLGGIKQIYDGCNDLFPRQTALPQVTLQIPAKLGQRFSELHHALEFDIVPHQAPVRMIGVLLALTGVKSSCLQVPVRVKTNPDIGISGWYPQSRN